VRFDQDCSSAAAGARAPSASTNTKIMGRVSKISAPWAPIFSADHGIAAARPPPRVWSVNAPSSPRHRLLLLSKKQWTTTCYPTPNSTNWRNCIRSCSSSHRPAKRRPHNLARDADAILARFRRARGSDLRTATHVATSRVGTRYTRAAQLAASRRESSRQGTDSYSVVLARLRREPNVVKRGLELESCRPMRFVPR
jgi:hypothetical protein